MTQAAERIAIFLPEVVAFGGAERGVLSLSRWLHQQHLPHRLLLYRDRLGLQGFADHPLDLTELRPGPGPRNKIKALRRWFGAQPPGGPAPMMAGYQAALHASLAGLSAFHTLMWDTPSLFSDDSQPDSLTRWLRRWLSDRILGHGLRSGGRTIVNSRYLKGESERLYGANVAIARMGGLEGAARPRPAVTAPDAIFSLLSVCRVEANKRIDWILRAVAALEARDPPLSHRVNWRLDVVGGGPLIAPLAALAQNLGMAERVRFHGFLDDQDLELLYAQARIFVMPARQGYGIPAIEALQRGIPVLLHRESGVSDILDDTPWCGVFDGPASAMPAALDSMIDRVLSGTHDAAPLPALPTEAAWAEDVARHCGWIK